MSAPVARVGDIGVGICPLHPSPVPYVTTFVTGATTVDTNGVNTGFVGTLGGCSCGHVSTAMTGSGTVDAEGSPVHRVGDLGTTGGVYTTIVGSPNVTSG